jgi:carbon storage regulator
MLILSRHIDEDIVIGEGENAIYIKVVDIRGDKARLGIEAPLNIPIHRQEIYDAIQRENLKAGQLPILPEFSKPDYNQQDCSSEEGGLGKKL